MVLHLGEPFAADGIVRVGAKEVVMDSAQGMTPRRPESGDAAAGGGRSVAGRSGRETTEREGWVGHTQDLREGEGPPFSVECHYDGVIKVAAF
jgi:hypothetical protein